MTVIEIMIEKSLGKLYGIVDYRNIRIEVSDRTIEGLERKVKSELKRLFQLHSNEIELTRCYDITALFDHFPSLKLLTVAKISGIDPTRLQFYATGTSFPSEDEAEKLEISLHKLGQELTNLSVCRKRPAVS